jgi:hypothetical protein
MMRDCSRRGFAALVLVLILGSTAVVPGAMASGRATGSGSLAASTRVVPAPPAARAAAAAHATPDDGLLRWFERLLGKAFGLPVGAPPTLDGGGCTDPNGANCG